MTQEELDRSAYASQEIIKLSEDLIHKLEANKATIEERRIANDATKNMTVDVVRLINQLLSEIKSSDSPAEQKLNQVVEIISSLASSLESSQRASEDEFVRLSATQEGMRRALDAVRETGNMRLQELRRIESLSQKDDPEARRPIGERPDTVATKRNARTLKQNRGAADN